ncbi:putative arabinose 5-phosphate isomerase [Capsicum baccatum]|uniref:Arabinose 5-phosphate isomerase n=1 Tax=Capsicum baccatum TaxID=33114 RepID=A0A2G2V7A2_CAPBA|nr:putative arabinose 5-phosphate isomerase [Capsicum baccatum]
MCILPLERELCPFDLAPVTSTAIQMVFGGYRGDCFNGGKEIEQRRVHGPTGREFKLVSPPSAHYICSLSGCLKRSLGALTNEDFGFCNVLVRNVMKKKEELPTCKEQDLIMDQLVELTSKGCGCLLVIDDGFHLLGTFTDGDLRRTLKSSGEGIFKLTVGDMCYRKPRTIGPDAMAVEAMQKMESPPSPVQFLPVIDHENILIGSPHHSESGENRKVVTEEKSGC